MPESESQLINCIEKSGRKERTEEILIDFKENYNNERLCEYEKEGFFIVKKYNDNICKTIYELIGVIRWEY